MTNKETVIIYAFPTCGKSELAMRLLSRGYTVVDTDHCPTSLKFDATRAQKRSALINAIMLKPDFIVTNLIDELIYFGIEPHMAFSRCDAQQAHDLMKQRGGMTIEVETLSSWIDGIGEKLETVNSAPVVLQNDEYLSDLINEICWAFTHTNGRSVKPNASFISQLEFIFDTDHEASILAKWGFTNRVEGLVTNRSLVNKIVDSLSSIRTKVMRDANEDNSTVTVEDKLLSSIVQYEHHGTASQFELVRKMISSYALGRRIARKFGTGNFKHFYKG
jgi:hypothetical protein